MVKTRASQSLPGPATPSRGSKRPRPASPSVDYDEDPTQGSDAKKAKKLRHFTSPGEQLHEEEHDASVRGSLEPTPGPIASLLDEVAHLPQSSATEVQVVVKGSTPFVNASREVRIEEYEEVIRQLEHEKAELTAHHKSLVCAVHSLGFGKDEALDVCASIRTEFDTVRGEEHKLTRFNLADAERVPNRRLLRNQPGLIRELKDQIKALEDQSLVIEARLAELQQEQSNALEESRKKDEEISDRDQQLDQALQRINVDELALKAEKQNAAQLAQEKEELLMQLRKGDANIERLDADKRGLEDDLERMTNDLDASDKRINALEAKLTQAREEHATSKQRLVENYEDRLGYMVEELNQEHRHVLIAERDISNQNAAYATLQGQYETVTTRNDNLDNDLEAAKALLEQQDQQIEVSTKELDKAQEENNALSDRITEMEQKADDLRDRAKELGNALEAERVARVDLEVEAGAANEEAKRLNGKIHDLELEINKLRAEAFGDQQEIARLEADLANKQLELEAELAVCETLNETITTKTDIIGELHSRIEALEKAIDDLEAAKDNEIHGKNALLDQKEAQIDELTDNLERKIQELAETVDERDRDYELLHEDFKSAQRQIMKLHSDVEVLDEDVKALRQENSNIIEEREMVKQHLSERDAMFEALKKAHHDLIAAGQHDAATLKHWAEQKQVELQQATRYSAAIKTAIPNGHIVTQHTVVAKHTVRDSGFFGSDPVQPHIDGEETETEAILEA